MYAQSCIDICMYSRIKSHHMSSESSTVHMYTCAFVMRAFL